jgi:phage replication O-like protein O
MDNIKLSNGYTKIANEILEKLSRTKMGGSSWMVLMAIFRKTYGYNKKKDWISYKQLEEITGLKKPNISRSIKILSKMGIVIKSDNGNKVIIGISKNFKVLSKRITVIKFDNQPLSNLQPTVIKSDQKYGYTKETIQKKYNISKPKIKNFPKRKKTDFKQVLGIDIKKPKASYEWQDHAVRMAKSLGFKPTPAWFKLFKKTYQTKRKNILDVTYSKIADLNPQDPEKYFYKVFYKTLGG